jgi:hypothetical protein
MVRPDGIPEDVYESAKRELLFANTKAHMLGIETDPLECLSSAILAERERCAGVADDHATAWGLAMGQQAKEIAAAIRKGAQ